MESPPFLRYLVPPTSKYSPQHHVLKHPQLPFLPQCRVPSIISKYVFSYLVTIFVAAVKTGTTNCFMSHIRWIYVLILLRAFAKLWKVTISFVMFLRPSVRTEQLGSHWMDFHEIWYASIFLKKIEKIQLLLKSDKYNGYLTWRPLYIIDISLNSS